MHELASLLDGPALAADAPRVISVCTGAGGLDLGLHRAGFRTVAMCEWDEWRRRLLARHWPGVPVHPDLVDLAEFAERDPDAVREWCGGRPDLLAGGTPCQNLSVGGNRLGLDGEKSRLFWDFMRLRNAVEPEWTLWENVAGAITTNAGLDFACVLGAFVGADVAVPAGGWGGAGVASGPWGGCVWRLVNAQHFGVPQRRRRVFIVGRLGGECPPEVLLERTVGGGHPAAGSAPRPRAPWVPPRAAGGPRRGVVGAGGLDDGAGGGAVDAARPGVGGSGVADAAGHAVAGTLGGGTPGQRGYRADLDSHGAYVAPVARDGAVADDAAARKAGADGGDVRNVAPSITSSPGFAAGCGHSGGDDQSLAVAATLSAGRAESRPGRRREDDVNLVAPTLERQGTRTGQFLGRDGSVVRADRVLPDQRVAGRAEGGRPVADVDEGGESGGDGGGGAASVDADGVRAADGLAGRVDGAALVDFDGATHALTTEGTRGGEDGTGRGVPIVAGTSLVDFDGATHTLTAEGFDASEDGTGRGAPIVAAHVPEQANTLKTPRGGGDTSSVEATYVAVDGGGVPAVFAKRAGAAGTDGEAKPESWGEAEHARLLSASDAHRGTALVAAEAWRVSHGGASEAGAVAPTITGEGGAGANRHGAGWSGTDLSVVGFHATQIPVSSRDVMPTLGASARLGVANADVPFVLGEVGEGAACAVDPLPDGRRYAACGDGVASPCATWIGMRLRRVMRGEDPDA